MTRLINGVLTILILNILEPFWVIDDGHLSSNIHSE